MLEKWKDFIHSHHYDYTNNFFESYLGMFPRRSCETVFAMFQFNITPDNRKGFHKDMTWSDIEQLLEDLLMEEINTPSNKNLPLYYTYKQ